MREDGMVLLGNRPAGKAWAGWWEFPGGKVEPGETEVEALQRELHEELGLWAEALTPLIRIQHDYPDKSVELSVWQVTCWSGESYGDAAGSSAIGSLDTTADLLLMYGAALLEAGEGAREQLKASEDTLLSALR